MLMYIERMSCPLVVTDLLASCPVVLVVHSDPAQLLGYILLYDIPFLPSSLHCKYDDVLEEGYRNSLYCALVTAMVCLLVINCIALDNQSSNHISM